jgi:hypothetical protein
MNPHREPPRRRSLPRRTPWHRLAWAWARGVFRLLERRRHRSSEVAALGVHTDVLAAFLAQYQDVAMRQLAIEQRTIAMMNRLDEQLLARMDRR